MGSAAADENSNQTASQIESASEDTLNQTYSNNTNSTSNCTNSTPISDTETANQSLDGSNTTVELLDELSGCCSVLLHVRNGYDVFSYRRDSSYAATLYFQELTWYGKKAIKEYKTVNGYFFHTIVTLDGWIVGMGGPDIVSVVNQIESLAGSTSVSGSITSSTISRATSLIASMGMGHFIIKSPSNVVGYAIVNGGTKTGLFTLGNGQYVSVPNSPSCYRSGYISTSTPVASAISLALNNPWGVNHRNIISYEIIKTSDVFNYITKVNIYASKSRSSDNIVFRGKFISGSSLPSAINKRYLGQIIKKISRPTTSFGYQNMIYTYSDILDTYNTTGSLPGSVGVGPWMVTVEDVVDTAGQVTNYIDTYHKLPSSVIVNGITISITTYLKLLTASVVQINKKDLNTLINPKSYNTAPAPRDTMSTGNLLKSDYLSIAQNVKSFMDSYGRAPNFAVTSANNAYKTSLGSYFGYQNMIYTYSKILVTYNTTGTLPDTIQVKAWKVISNPNAKTFTIPQIINAANEVQIYVETNYRLPSSVTINEQTVSMSSFLELLTTSVLQIYNNDLITLVDSVSFGTAPSPLDSMSTGNLLKSDYISIAKNVKNFMKSYGRAPNFAVTSANNAYKTSLGSYFGYQNMIYTYSKILVTYNTTGTLPDTIQVKAWKKIVTDFKTTTFTIEESVTAATWVKNYIETNQKLPDYVTINNINLNMQSFLELLTTVTLKINSGNLTSTTLVDYYKTPTTPKDSQKTGLMSQKTYIDIAPRVKGYMDSKTIAPPYSSYSTLGTYFGYENLIYTYTNVLDSYNKSTTKTLPTSVPIKPWTYIVNYVGTFTIHQTTNAATWVKNYIETNQELPHTVSITGTNLQGATITKQLTMPTFLELLTTVTLKIKNTTNTPTTITQNYKTPTTPKDSQKTGLMSQKTYIDIAQRVKGYMDSKTIAPPYSSYSTLGTYFGYENLIYTYSKILDTYNTTGTLPENVAVDPWMASVTVKQVAAAAVQVKTYIDNNHKLPSSATVKGNKISMATFLNLLTTSVLHIYNKDLSTLLKPQSYYEPSPSKDKMKTRTMTKTEYIFIAKNVINYMTSNGKAPGYATALL